MKVEPYNFIQKKKKEIEEELTWFCINSNSHNIKDLENELIKKCKEYELKFKNDLFCLFSDSDLSFSIIPLLNSDVEFSQIQIIPCNLKSELVLLKDVDYYKFIKPLSKNYNKFKYIIREKEYELENYNLFAKYNNICIYVLKDTHGI